MLSFPSTLNSGGANISLPHNPSRSVSDFFSNLGSSFANAFTNSLFGGLNAWVNGASASGSWEDMSRLPYDAWRYPTLDRKNISHGLATEAMDGQAPYVGIHPSLSFRPQFNSTAARNLWYSNPVMFSPEIYSLMNTYRYVYDNGISVPSDLREYDEEGNVKAYYHSDFDKNTISPSLFNPYYGIQRIGPTKNTPLTDDSSIIGSSDSNHEFSRDFTDCSIATLCKLSTQEVSELGQARYKYSDFMYCKDLGMPNNRMITLRKFSNPVGDIIMGPSAVKQSEEYSVNETPGDIGRLICYFDTDDNNLEDILQYNYAAKWVEKQSEIQQLQSQEDDRRSPLGMLLNTMSAQYRESFTKSVTGQNNLLDWFVSKTPFSSMDSSSWYKGHEIFTNYDKNKVYDPVDTMRSMYIYDGNLEFNHEFTLTFNYTLRSYDNINPKAAMLDLLANITAVTYKRGHFWGGRQEIIGPQPNVAGWKKADAIIDKGWDQLGGFISSLEGGGFNVKGMLGNLSNFFSNIGESFNAAVGAAKEIINKGAEAASNYVDSGEAKADLKKAGAALGTMLKAKMKDTLGRPQLYAFNSILTGDNTGLWHVTIGNPRNPIAVMGNMILTDAKITHYGPLGIDDFPTRLKVTVTLRHARPRDAVSIQKMYTRGVSAIYTNIENPRTEGKGNANSVGVVHYNVDDEAGRMYVGDINTERIRRNINEIK